MNRRVLFVAYIFPPTGGAGVQRTAKFVKYLREFGWIPSVLTVQNPSVPLLDGSVGADVPADTVVRRARSLEPSYAWKATVSNGSAAASRAGVGRVARGLARRVSQWVLQPDPQILWYPAAVREGVRWLREVAHDAIVATAPPFSSLLVGGALARRTGLPLLLDYRDEWDLSNAYAENRQADWFSRSVQGTMQRNVVRRAAALVATTRASAQALDRIRARAGSAARVSWIYNGFDRSDFPVLPPQPSRRTYRVAYTGTLWNLTDVTPLVEAVRILADGKPDLAAQLELVFAGRRTGPQQQQLDRLRRLPCQLIEHPYLDHRRALELAQSADALCVLLAAVPGAARVVPAKVFELMATGRPVLAVAPEGELREILARYPAAHCFAPADPAGIANFLAGRISAREHAGNGALPGWDASPFERRHQAGQMAELLKQLVQERPCRSQSSG